MIVNQLKRGYQVDYHLCEKGKAYGIMEMTNSTRYITTTIAVSHNPSCRLAVRTNIPVPKSKVFTVIKEIKKLQVQAPIYIGQVLLEKVAGINANVIAASEVLE